MFELESMTKVKVLDVRVLSKKDRKTEEPPGAQLLLQARMAADVLTAFDGSLKSHLYRKPMDPKQREIDGADSLEPTALAEHVKRIRWEYEQTGCTIEIDYGLGGKRNLPLTDCRVHRVIIKPLPGGAVELQWTVDAPALSDEVRGKLTGYKSTEISMTIVGPDGGEQ